MEAANMKLKYDTELTKIVQQTHIPPQVQIMEALLADYHLKPMNDLSIFMYPNDVKRMHNQQLRNSSAMFLTGRHIVQ